MKTKLKVEYIILGALVVLLSLYVILRNTTTRIRYELPEPPKLAAVDFDSLSINYRNNTVNMAKSEDGWVILPEEYRADMEVLNQMLAGLAEFSIIDLISESENYARYELDDSSRIEITAKKEDEILRQFEIGKNAELRRFTFVKLPGDHRVYSAKGNLRQHFDENKEKFRERSVLAFDNKSITEIITEWEGQRVRLLRSIVPVEGEDAESVDEEDTYKWETPEGEVWDPLYVNGLINRLSELKAFRYLEDDAELGEEYMIITAKGAGVEYTLTLHDKVKEEFKSTSSMSESPFRLSDWQSEQITKVFLDKKLES